MVIMETLQSWVFLLVLLTVAVLGTRLLVDFMTWISGEQIVPEHARAAAPEPALLYLVPDLPAGEPRQLPVPLPLPLSATDPRK